MKPYRYFTASRFWLLSASVILFAFFYGSIVIAADNPLPDGEEMARKINSRSFGKAYTRKARLELVDKKGRSRNYTLRIFRRFTPDATNMAFYVLAPPEMKHTAFLCYDYFDGKRHDDQWLYTPSKQKSRRLPEGSRKEPFLGSEFSFEDIKKINRVEIHEYKWKTLEEKKIGDHFYYLVEQVPITPQLAMNLGFSRILNYIEKEHGIRVKMEFWDTKGKPLKTFQAKKISKRNGVWRVGRIEAVHKETGRRSIFHIESTDYKSPVDDSVFSLRAIEKEMMK